MPLSKSHICKRCGFSHICGCFLVTYADAFHKRLLFAYAFKDFFTCMPNLIRICDRYSFQNAYVRTLKFYDIRGTSRIKLLLARH